MAFRKRREIQGETVELNDAVSDRANRIERLHADNCELIGPIGLLMSVDDLVTNRITGELGGVRPVSEAPRGGGAMPIVDCEFRYCTFVDVTVYVPDQEYDRAIVYVTSD